MVVLNGKYIVNVGKYTSPGHGFPIRLPTSRYELAPPLQGGPPTSYKYGYKSTYRGEITPVTQL